MANTVPKEPNSCSGEDEMGNPCPSKVQPRRPSESGMHYCSSLSCQRKKQRDLYARRTQAARKDRDAEILDFGRAMTQPRTGCSNCGRSDAIEGYIHPNEEGEPCSGAGGLRFGFAGTAAPALVMSIYSQGAFA